MLKKHHYINNNKPQHLRNIAQSTLTITNLIFRKPPYETDKAGIIQTRLKKGITNYRASLVAQDSSVAQSCPTLCDAMDCSRPGLPVHHQLLEFTQTHAHWVDDISSSVVPFSCLQSFPASESFQMSQFFASGGQSTGASASTSFLPMNTQDWSPLEWTSWIACSPRESQKCSPTPQFKSIILWCSAFFQSNSHIHTWLLEKP